jgi:alpha-beta hydrolase superfamily lysophospholipase
MNRLTAAIAVLCSAWLVRAAELVRAALPSSRLELPGEKFEVNGRPAFLYLPEPSKRSNPQPWIFYAPTLPPYPDNAERWMHEHFLEAGVAVAGIDVGEAYGSPESHKQFDALYDELVSKRNFAKKVVLLGRSRGGLWVSSWAIANPSRVAAIAGIYPVFDYTTYPGIEKAAPAYGLSAEALKAREDEFNPIKRVSVLAHAKIPVFLIHGDSDKVVPLPPNSGAFLKEYQKAGAESLITLQTLEKQGHNMYEGFFRSQALVDFVIKNARVGMTFQADGSVK